MHKLLKLPMLIISLLQGLALFGLYRAADTQSWPSESPVWSYPLWTIALAVPLLLLLSINRGNYKSVALQTAAFGGVLVLLAAYTGYQAQPWGEFPVFSLSFAFFAAITLACFKALMYMQQRANEVALSYPVLFSNSWRNFLVAALAALFVFVFWLILMLWGQLFRVIDIDFFQDLFREDWFLFPVLSVAFGLGTIIFRDLGNIIDSITRLFHWLFKLLLPMVVGISVIFLAALPVVGLDALWSTGRGTALLLWLLAIALFFTNAVYQDGREASPYPVFVHRMIYGGLALLPVISALSLYGLVERLMQYGWTVERCWAVVTWFILSMFAFGYAVGIVRQRDSWTLSLARVNTAMGIVVLAIMLLASSPVLDFRKISLHSQLARVEAGTTELRNFDFWYARQHLARPGYLAIERIKAENADGDAGLLQAIESPRRHRANAVKTDVEKMWANVYLRPQDIEVPAGLRSMIELVGQQISQYGATLLRIDMDEDGQDEYVLIVLYEYGIGVTQYYYREDDNWRLGYFQTAPNRRGDDIDDRLRDGEIKLLEPRFKDLEIDGIRMQPMQ